MKTLLCVKYEMN